MTSILAAGVGMTEPEPDYMPLNPKLSPRFFQEDSEPEQDYEEPKSSFEYFVEDPVLVRERMDQRRALKHQQHGRQDGGKPMQLDTVGKVSSF